MKRILVIDDNDDIRKIIGYDLIKAGYDVDDAMDADSGYQKATQGDSYDLIIIDWMMPGMNGIELIRLLRSKRINSVLFMLTAKDRIDDLEEAFAAGADDYLRKPFATKELELRIRHHLRQTSSSISSGILCYGDLTLDKRNRRVRIKDHLIALTRKEIDLLSLFLTHPDTILSRDQILNELWGFHYVGDTRIVDVHIFKLRSKLKESCVQISASRGIGYLLERKKPQEIND